VLYTIKRAVLQFLACVRWLGWRHPFWLAFGCPTYRLKGRHYRQVAERIKDGDILIRRFDGYLNTWLIPGWWNHAGIYIGGVGHEVVHAIGEGVVRDDLIDFMRTDHLMVLRAPAEFSRKAILKIRKLLGTPYDYDFDFKDAGRFSCTELVAHQFPGFVTPRRRFRRDTIVADDIVAALGFSVIYDSRLVDKCEQTQ